MKSIITKDFGATNAENFEYGVVAGQSKIYVMIGRSTAWPNTANANLLDDVAVETPYDTVDYKNNVLKNGIILKKLLGSDIQPVVPRVDWAANVVYTAYDQTANLFIKTLDTAISGGTVNVSNALANTVVANGMNLAFSTPALSAGDFIRIGTETKEIVRINVAGDFLQVNSNFTSAYTAQTMFKAVTSSPQYSYNFYVRNNVDQVFKCLFNNNDAISNTMPEITIGGQLPENPFIETVDGYKWKYIYTIPSGLKQKFFSSEYMPVIRDATVFANRRDGALDIIKITNPGSGYFNGSTINNYSIVSVTGDGNGANVSVDVLNGVITEVNILNGGSGYTTATLTVDDPLQLPGGNAANLTAVIGPQGGHGSDPTRELGASDQMISLDFQGIMGGQLPTYTNGTSDFRQIALVNNPSLANGSSATATVYPMSIKIFVDNPAIDFTPDATVYVGSSLATATFYATVVYFDSVENILYINNPVGDIDSIQGKTISQNESVFAQVFSVVKPDINTLSGEILYIENRAKIIRSPNQTETVKIVVEF
jgi:hypothetical protein